MNNDKISQAIVRLFESERYYAELILQMKRIINKDLPIPAGVSITEHINLCINPELFNEYTIEARVAILKHECEHILRDHISRAREYAPEVYSKDNETETKIINSQKHKALNIAMDCSINYGLKDCPEDGVFPKTFDLPDGQTFEWYANKLKDNEKMKNINEFDEHSIWSESHKEKEVLKEKIRASVNEAAKRTRAAGKMTAENELLVDNFNSGNLIKWKYVLRNFVAKAIETKVEASKKKRNRRYGTMYAGTVKIEELNLGVAIDTSGSVSDESLIQFMKEIHNIAKYAKVLIVEADSEIKNSYVFDPKKKYQVKGRGGTAYQPAFDFFNKEDIDAMIYFGDMDSSDKPIKPKYSVLWAIVGSQTPPVDFGRKLYVK